MTRQLCISALLLAGTACGGKAPAAPTGPILVTGSGLSLSGTVTDSETTVPVFRATVSILSEMDGIATRTTDDRGRYSFTGLQPSPLTLSVSADGFVPATRSVALVTDASVSFVLVPAGCRFGLLDLDLGTGLAAIYSNGAAFSKTLSIRAVRGGEACKWTSTSSVPWITLSPSSWTGDATAVLQVDRAAVFRCGSILVAGNRINILQHAFPSLPGVPLPPNTACDAYWAQF